LQKAIIDEGIDGYLIDLHDIKILEKRILHLIENKHMREKMSLYAQKKSRNYLPEDVMPKWIALFEKMNNGV
jgi:glycosyltransferase involved in cell wall biosynthesis